MKINTLTPEIFLITFPNQKELTFTMCRVEEFYEAASDNLNSKVFTWPEFIDNFLDDAGNIDYFSGWSGFNVPGYVFLDWERTFQDKSRLELELVQIVNSVRTGPKFYVIATIEGDGSVENHEIAHAMYYVNDEYRASMQLLNEALAKDARELLIKGFVEMTYGENVHEDELQAYLSTSEYVYMFDRFGMEKEMYDRIVPAYIAVFDKFKQ